jgi:hypothetical protein
LFIAKQIGVPGAKQHEVVKPLASAVQPEAVEPGSVAHAFIAVSHVAGGGHTPVLAPEPGAGGSHAGPGERTLPHVGPLEACAMKRTAKIVKCVVSAATVPSVSLLPSKSTHFLVFASSHEIDTVAALGTFAPPSSIVSVAGLLNLRPFGRNSIASPASVSGSGKPAVLTTSAEIVTSSASAPAGMLSVTPAALSVTAPPSAAAIFFFVLSPRFGDSFAVPSPLPFLPALAPASLAVEPAGQPDKLQARPTVTSIVDSS